MLLKQFAITAASRLDWLPHGVSFAADYRRKFKWATTKELLVQQERDLRKIQAHVFHGSVGLHDDYGICWDIKEIAHLTRFFNILTPTKASLEK